MDYNRYSPPIRRRNLPEDAPALYEDEIKASSAWLPETQWSLVLPDDYPLRHELMLILDSLDYISKNISDPDCANMLAEALQQARELIWLKLGLKPVGSVTYIVSTAVARAGTCTHDLLL